MKEDFLLTTPLARRLYHEAAEELPVIDYHNHLSTADLAADRICENIYELWLKPDPYKHRAMRICGVPERLITGDGSAEEKFFAWCHIFPMLVGNPLYHWSVMELSRVFGIRELPCDATAQSIWERANAVIGDRAYSMLSLLRGFRAEYIAPCAALNDPLTWTGRKDGLTVAPSLRGDDLLLPDRNTLSALEKHTGIRILTEADYRLAVARRLDAFAAAGCRFTDHALDNGFRYLPDDGSNSLRFAKLLAGETLGEADRNALCSQHLRMLGGEYANRNFTLQLHIGAQRTTSTRLRTLAGAAGGFASIGNCMDVRSITALLDDLERAPAGLPKTVLMTLNPADNSAVSVLAGSYARDGVTGLIGQGPAWWWCDHLTGMTDVFESIAAFGVLQAFIGMTTDSRSVLSFVRHEYFRRVLCKWMGEKAARDELPDSFEALAPVVRAVCYENVRRIL